MEENFSPLEKRLSLLIGLLSISETLRDYRCSAFTKVFLSQLFALYIFSLSLRLCLYNSYDDFSHGDVSLCNPFAKDLSNRIEILIPL